MFNSDNEIWSAVKLLEGKTLLTYVDESENRVITVEDTGNNKDKVIIDGRNTFPLREDIIAAYKLLFVKKELSRNYDLDWLAIPSKQTSSIVFKIIGVLTEGESYLIKNKSVLLKLRAT